MCSKTALLQTSSPQLRIVTTMCSKKTENKAQLTTEHRHQVVRAWLGGTVARDNHANVWIQIAKIYTRNPPNMWISRRFVSTTDTIQTCNGNNKRLRRLCLVVRQQISGDANLQWEFLFLFERLPPPTVEDDSYQTNKCTKTVAILTRIC